MSSPLFSSGAYSWREFRSDFLPGGEFVLRTVLDREADSGFTYPVNITLFGYPKTGKTTLFNLLTGAHIDLKSYDDSRQEPNIRSCQVPDPRLDEVASLYPEKEKISTTFDITDLGGISCGEVKDSLFLATLRNAEGLVHVVRGFQNKEIPHPKEDIDPVRDIRLMREDLVLADFVLVASRLERLEKDLKKGKAPDSEKEKALLERLKPLLEEGRGIRDAELMPAEEKALRSFAFLSQKPLLHIINIGEENLDGLNDPVKIYPGLKDPGFGRALAFCGKIESELTELEEEERTLFMAEYGFEESSASVFFHQALHFLDRISFFTVGKDEVRAWTLRKGNSALSAAGTVHTDMEKGFIRAEVVSWLELTRLGSLQKAKEAGAIRLEGKDYIVEDGDVIYFRFSP